MIPASDRYEARYRHESDRHPHFTTKPVIAWSNEGVALMADMKTGRLREADSWDNFAGLAKPHAPLVGLIPGDGWFAEIQTDTGDTESRAVVAWTLDAEGTCTPLVADSDGYAEDATGRPDFVRIYHPGEAS